MLANLPDKVIFFHSAMPASRGSATRCAQFLQARGVEVRTSLIEAFDAAQVSNEVVRNAAEHDLGNVLLNYTGGTKVMSLAAYQALPPHIPRIYFDPRVGLSVNQGLFVPLAHPPLKVMDILSLHAAVETIEDPHATSPQFRANKTTRVICDAILRDPRKVNLLLKFRDDNLSKLRGRNGWKPLLGPLPIPFSGQDPKLADQLVLAMGQDGLLRPETDGFSPNGEGLSFLDGFWWERFVEAQLQKGLRSLGLGPDSVNLCTNLSVRWKEAQSSRTTNEFDLVFSFQDRLFIISCTAASEGVTEDHRHQVEALVERLGGHLGKAMVACTSTPDVLKNLQARASSRVLLANTRDWLKPANLLRTWLEQ
jgi:hypothetical protein